MRIKVIGLLMAMTLALAASNAATAASTTDIFAAAKSGDVRRVEALVAAGTDINVRNKDDQSALEIASIYNRPRVAAILLDSGASISSKSHLLGLAPMHVAASNGNVEIIELLLAHGADVDIRDSAGWTPLHWAALLGREKAAEALLAHRATVSMASYGGETPLHDAAKMGRKDIVSLLLANGANPTATNDEGKTPLQEVNSADLIPNRKAEIVALLTSAASVAAGRQTSYGQPDVGQPIAQPPAASGASSMPNCWDLPGLAQRIKAGSPGIDNATLYEAILQAQVMMGCRQPLPQAPAPAPTVIVQAPATPARPIYQSPPPPQQTSCSWLGSDWVCTTGAHTRSCSWLGSDWVCN